MRLITMNKLALPAALGLAALLAGCASTSSDSGGVIAASSASSQSSQSSPIVSGTSAAVTPPSDTSAAAAPSATVTEATSAAPASAAPSAISTSAAATTTGTRVVVRPIPASVTSATISYVGPAGNSPLNVHKSVTGSAYQSLVTDLDALTSAAGFAHCNVDNGESSTITIVEASHTVVFIVPGIPCRGVREIVDGKPQPELTGSAALNAEIRSISGFTASVHPGVN